MNFHSNKAHQNIKITVDNWWAVLGSSGFEVKDKKNQVREWERADSLED